jgi:hypothetical protein
MGLLVNGTQEKTCWNKKMQTDAKIFACKPEIRFKIG